MPLPSELNKQIVDFLMALPRIAEKETRHALLAMAHLDDPCKAHCDVDSAPAQCFPALVDLLSKYSQLQDGRDALETLLKAARQQVGVDKRQLCDLLIQEWQYYRQRGKTFVPDYSHDVIVSYAFRDNTPATDEEDGWITQFTDQLKQLLNHKLGGSDRYSFSLICLDQRCDGKRDVPPEIVKRLRSAATLMVILSPEYVESFNTHALRTDLAGMLAERTGLNSSVFLIERNRFPDQPRPPELHGVQPYYLGTTFRQISQIDQLSRDLAAKLHALRREQNAVAQFPQPRGHNQSKAKTAFIVVDAIDRPLGTELGRMLKKNALGYILPLPDAKPAERRAYLKKSAQMCQAFILVYGKVRPNWVMGQIGEIRKISGQWQQQIIYDGPPEQKEELPFDLPEIPIVVCRNGICEVCEAQLRDLIGAAHGGKIL